MTRALGGGRRRRHRRAHRARAGPGRRRAPAAARTRASSRWAPSAAWRRTLIPARGYPLELIPPVPMPRKPTPDLLRLPAGCAPRSRGSARCSTAVDADVVVGFGGYVALPAYLAARGRVPIVVHEANARAGLANKVGARFAVRVAAAVPGTGLPDAEVIGIPLRRSITTLDRAALRPRPASTSGCPATARCCWCSAARRARARSTRRWPPRCRGCVERRDRRAARARAKNTAVPAARPRPAYVPVPYLERMDLAYAAADAVLCRAGAMTVAEVSAVGLPAVYVPLPHGNGEQALNAGAGGRRGRRRAGAGRRADRRTGCSPSCVPLLTDPRRLAAMGAAARATGHAEADERAGPHGARGDRGASDERPRGADVTAPAALAGPGAPDRHRRRRDERHRPDPAGPRGARCPGRTPRTRAPCSRCGRRAPRSRSATTPANLDQRAPAHRSWCPPRSGRPTPSWPRPASAGSPCCTGPRRWPR